MRMSKGGRKIRKSDTERKHMRLGREETFRVCEIKKSRMAYVIGIGAWCCFFPSPFFIAFCLLHFYYLPNGLAVDVTDDEDDDRSSCDSSGAAECTEDVSEDGGGRFP